MYTWIDVKSPGDISQLAKELPSDYNPPAVVRMLKDELTPDICGILVESMYVDKDYRSTYYSFYAKKGLRYSPFCVRLHFLKGGVSLTADLDLQSTTTRLEEAYVGYMVLRPTPITPIGRTVLSIHAKKSVDGAIIEGRHHVHVLGYRLEVKGFPYMQQHTDISVCAHAVCWSILRHFTQQHRRYAEFLVTDITQMAASTNPGGLVPSRGLRIEQACRVFSHAGLFPDVYEKDEFPENFYRLLNAYVESGFPVFAAMHNRSHAITVMGHGKPDRDAYISATDAILFSWEAINSVIVVDDNHMPYLSAEFPRLRPTRFPELGTS